MSNIEKNGGPAFPINDLNAWEGMSLRDYFAGQALSGLVIGIEIANEGESKLLPVSTAAYKIADAMLAEKKKGEIDIAGAVDILWNAAENAKLKTICENVLKLNPSLTREQILFNYTVRELIEMLGEHSGCFDGEYTSVDNFTCENECCLSYDDVRKR